MYSVLRYRVFAGQSRPRKLIAVRVTTGPPCIFAHRACLSRIPARRFFLPLTSNSGTKCFAIRTYRKRSSGQDGRPESRLADERSLLGALLRNVSPARGVRAVNKSGCYGYVPDASAEPKSQDAISLYSSETHALSSHTYALLPSLFCSLQKLNLPTSMLFCTLWQKTQGGGGASRSPRPCRPR